MIAVEVKQWKKFKCKEIEEYLKGEWIKEFSGTKNTLIIATVARKNFVMNV